MKHDFFLDLVASVYPAYLTTGKCDSSGLCTQLFYISDLPVGPYWQGIQHKYTPHSAWNPYLWNTHHPSSSTWWSVSITTSVGGVKEERVQKDLKLDEGDKENVYKYVHCFILPPSSRSLQSSFIFLRMADKKRALPRCCETTMMMMAMGWLKRSFLVQWWVLYRFGTDEPQYSGKGKQKRWNKLNYMLQKMFRCFVCGNRTIWKVPFFEIHFPFPGT